jgi:hypothetical protein
MRRRRPLLLACAAVVVGWIIVTWIIPWPAHCTADELTGCHAFGSIQLSLFYCLPFVLLLLLGFALPGILDSIARRLRSRGHR